MVSYQDRHRNIYFSFEYPVFVLGFLKVGKRATILSFVNVVCVSVMTMLLPVGQITDNILMNALVGGVLLGLGVGLSLKMGFTTGGMDIISCTFTNNWKNSRKLHADSKWYHCSHRRLLL